MENHSVVELLIDNYSRLVIGGHIYVMQGWKSVHKYLKLFQVSFIRNTLFYYPYQIQVNSLLLFSIIIFPAIFSQQYLSPYVERKTKFSQWS